MKNVGIVKILLSSTDGTIRVVIPKEIREKFGLTGGDKLLVSYNKKKQIVFEKVDQSL